jgi:putative chitinase
VGVQIDHKKFFDAIRSTRFQKGLTQSQVDGIELILSAWETTYQDRTTLPQLADILGQTYWETAQRMQPIHEFGDASYFRRMYDISGSRPEVARTLGNVNQGDGVKYAGMGFIQCTGRANARRATKRMRELKLIPADVDFEATPDLLMRPEYAVHVLFLGMEEGWFTGKKLDDYIDDVPGGEHDEFVKARAIINGKDRAAQIADIADDFFSALKVSVRAGAAASAETPTAPPVAVPAAQSVEPAKPVAAPSSAEPAPAGWFEHLLEVLRSGRKP